MLKANKQHTVLYSYGPKQHTVLYSYGPKQHTVLYSYGPTSNLPMLDRLLEPIVVDRLQTCFERYDPTEIVQSACKKEKTHSSKSAMYGAFRMTLQAPWTK